MASAAGEGESERPDNSAFKQQQLPAWQPVISANAVLPAFFIIGLIFLPIGIALLITSNSLREIQIDYTGIETSDPCFQCTHPVSRNISCTCYVPFSIDQSFEGDVYMYYALSNYYQNHRRYGKSRDDRQLNGVISALTNPATQCQPYDMNGNLPIAPCGAIANSMFNDTLKLYFIGQNKTYIPIPLLKKNIAWWTDKNTKFRNPPGDNFTQLFQGTAKPFSWRRPVYALDPMDPNNNGFLNEDFIVWMRPAAFPNFRKLYGIITKNNSASVLPAGDYVLAVNYNYPVITFDGHKQVILSTISWMGGKNPFLGIAYIVVGCLCFIMGLLILFVHHKYGNDSNDCDVLE